MRAHSGFRALPVVAVFVLLVRSALAADSWPADAPPVADKVRQLMQDRSYAEAVKAIDEAAAAKDAPKDYLAYLKGRALLLQKRYDDAAAVFDAMQKDFPKSTWLRRARFAKAVALARKGDFRSAELIVRREAEYLLSADRKQQIADIYIEFADALFKPPKETDTPDYAKALEFYQKALEVGPKEEKRIEVELLVAQCVQHLEKWAEAAALYETFIKHNSWLRVGEADAADPYPADLDLPFPDVVKAVPKLIDAFFRLGECRLAEGNRKQARQVWQDLLAHFGDAKSDRIAEAQFQLAATWNIPKPQSSEELNLGVAALRAFIERFPTHTLASRAHLEIAESYLERARPEDAAAALKAFLADPRYRDREEIPAARELLGRCYLLQKKYPQAIDAWREYLVKHPAHKEWNAVQRAIIDTEFLMACEKLSAKQYNAANKLFAEFMAKYPLDGRIPRILLLMNRKAVAEEKWDEAMANWRRIVSKYPETNEAALAQFSIADALERKLGKLEDALKEYRKVTWGQSAGEAQRAIARLTATGMSVATERVFRSNETPSLKLITRNVEAVTVRAYKIDLETYFRKMHLASGVEGLDIALIDPDRTFEFKVPGYAKHQQLESRIDVPLPGGARSGVMAVTVSGKTLEATTLVIQSDLDVIVKASRDEVFVFAENLRTGKPWPTARLLVSNGQQVFAEGTTGPDGVLQKSYKELKDAGDVRVFAVADGQVASNVVGLQGVGVARGLTDKGYVYTDRPAYRAGQMVHVRGCLRHAAGDLYTVEKDKKYTLDVFDPRNRILWQETVKLGQFGSFHCYFALPTTSPEGQYRVLVHDDDRQNYQGVFTVRQYHLEPMRLTVDTPRHVYYRGEEIKGTIRATYYYGAPLAGREIRYQLADDRQHTATTDAKGEVHFKLPTRDFSETQLLTLRVSLPERNLQAAQNYMLSAEGFSIAVSTLRPVFVAGETFEATLKAIDAEGKPVAEKLSLKVLEQTTVQGKVGERLVEEHKITTAADGTARKTLKLAKGGNYVVRAEGIDRFKNPVTGECAVQISGDEDEVRLRILADAHTYKLGDTAAVNVHWREPPALGLLTFQGARVLDYKLVELKTGLNELSIPMTDKLVPNFELSVAVMTDAKKGEGGRGKGELQSARAGHFSAQLNKGKIALPTDRPPLRFHEATSPFTVNRDLRVKIVATRKSDSKRLPRPGDEIEIALTTADLQGKPVAAELSLAMIEQSLLDRFREHLAPIQDYFQAERREPAVRTTSSITFAYNPDTQPINPRLLAEEDRLALAAEEEASRAAGFAGAAMGRRSRRSQAPFVISVVPVVEPSERHRSGIQEEEEEKLGLPSSDDPFAERDTTRSGDLFGASLGAPFARSQQTLGRGYGGSGFGGRAAGHRSLRTDIAASPRAASGDFDSLINLITSNVRPVTWLGRDGTVQPFGDWQPASQSAISPELRRAQAAERNAQLRAVALLAAAETAYWNPAIVTDKDGLATVTFTLPDESTAWRLLAKGITTDTLAGEAAEPLVVKKDLFGELKLPPSFTDGDQPNVIASIHNDAIEKGPIEVTLRTTIGGRSVEDKTTVEASGKGIRDVAFRLQLEGGARDEGRGTGEAVDFVLTVAAGERQDVVERSVPLLPDGVPVYAAASGSAAADATVWVEPPRDMALSGPRLSILIGPTMERSLLDVLLAPPPPCQLETGRLASGLETATSDLMAAIGLQGLLGTTRGKMGTGTSPETGFPASASPGSEPVPVFPAAGPQAQELDARIRAAVGLLVTSQHDDGGWGWTSAAGQSERYATSRAVWALSLARKAGYRVPDAAMDKAVGWLQDQIVATTEDDYETKAILLGALATVNKADFALANRLYRERQRLSAAGLVHLALALAEMDRKPTAVELLDLLAKRNVDETASRRTAVDGSLPWSQSPSELRALWALALERVSPQSPKAKELVDWLLGHRLGHRWSPDKATGPATLALCQWFARSRFEGEKYTLSVFVNDVLAKRLAVDPAAGTQTIEVPRTMLKKEGKQRINFQLTGRGRYTYQCILGGFVPADKLKGTTGDWRIARTYEPAPLERNGREVPRGFGVLQGTYTEFKNPLNQLPVAARGLVELRIERKNLPQEVPDGLLEYLVVTEPVPSGAAVVENSVRGGFEQFELSPDVITFYVGNRREPEPIRYEVCGYLPGGYRAVPAVVRNAYRPEQMAVSAAKSLVVLPLGAKSADPYRLTPDELFALGRHAFQNGDLKTAGRHLTGLLKDWNLCPEAYKQTVQMLLDVHLELGPPVQVVRLFEIVKEKWPQEEIPFAKIMKVAAAYHEMGEHERSYLVFRATVESSFVRDCGVAGFLEAQGHFLRSVDVLGRLLREYPPEGYVAESTYALAQHVFAKAPEVAADAVPPRSGGMGGMGMFNVAGPSPATGEGSKSSAPQPKKPNRVDLVRRAWKMLESFLTEYPDDPAADQAAFAAATALLDLKAFDAAAAACDRYAKRYPKSELLDGFWYMIGYCRFAGGRHEAAIEMCRKVAEAKRTDPTTGREEDARNKWQAVYILGQVYHSLGKAADAIREYRRVEDRFADAKQAIDYFLRKAIELPEVVTLRPGEPAEVELKFRNVPACDLKVYRIDLTKFALLKRNLGGITEINLAGIRPHHEESVALGDGKDYRDRTRKLRLPLKDEGAYLVVCRGENLYASGLVLLTPLAIEVQADAVSGRVRATLKDRAADKCLPEVHVKVIGSGNQDFVSGQTDLRGVFVADGIQGAVTVLAQAGPSRYAFYRAPQAAVPMPAVVRGAAPRNAGHRGASAEAAATPRTSIDLTKSSEGEEDIRAALKAPAHLEFIDTPLTDVIDHLKDQYKIEIQLDAKALGEADIDSGTPITKNLKGVSLKSALRLVLREHGLTYLIKDGVLLITTPEEADNQLETKIYPVADLVLPPGVPAGSQPDSLPGAGGGSQPDFDSLIDLIKNTIKPTSWDDVGGSGTISPFVNNLSIVVSQTQEVHEEIEALLEKLRSIGPLAGGWPKLSPRSAEEREKARGGQGMGGMGMGGMGGGMGGSMGGMAAPPAANAPGQPADLLQGVQDTNRSFQGKQSGKLNDMYRKSSGKGGVGAGDAF